MKPDFKNIAYLKFGNQRQQEAYNCLTKYNILEPLQRFDPILVGTIPINIHTETSDLDIICCYEKQEGLIAVLKRHFKNKIGFTIRKQNKFRYEAIVANFRTDEFEIEIFGQKIPTSQQEAYQHMVIEHKLLEEKGETFRKEIIELKQKGYKTEVAFGILLGLKGNAYEELLKLGNK